MKKLVALVLVMVGILALVGCNNTTNDLQKRFPEYYNLDTFKGIEVYVWQTDGGTYKCGAMLGTNRGKTFEEILNLEKNSATFEEMRTILSSYDTDKEEITIIPIKINTDGFEIITDEFEQISEIFWDNLQNSENSNVSIENNKIVNIALEHCKTNYDFIDTTYDSVNDEWTVEFWETGAKLPAQRVVLDKNGNVLSVWFAE